MVEEGSTLTTSMSVLYCYRTENMVHIDKVGDEGKILGGMGVGDARIINSPAFLWELEHGGEKMTDQKMSC